MKIPTAKRWIFTIFNNFSSYINGSVWVLNFEKLWLLQFSFAISVDDLSEFLQNCPIHVHNILDKGK